MVRQASHTLPFSPPTDGTATNRDRAALRRQAAADGLADDIAERIDALLPAPLRGHVRFHGVSHQTARFTADSSSTMYLLAGELRGGLEDRLHRLAEFRRCRVKLGVA